jgi:hypothetical protein
MARVTRRTAVKRIPRKPKAAPEYSYIDQNLRKECLEAALRASGPDGAAYLVSLAQTIYNFVKGSPAVNDGSLSEPTESLNTPTPSFDELGPVLQVDIPHHSKFEITM